MQPRSSDYGIIMGTSIAFLLLTQRATSIEVSPRYTVCNSNDEPRSCIDLKECHYYMRLLRLNPITGWRNVFTNLCSTTPSQHHVCCPTSKNSAKEYAKPLEALMRPNPEIVEFHPYPSSASEMKPAIDPMKFPDTFGMQCGLSKRVFDRIVGGGQSPPGAWPWIANLGYQERNGMNFLCGGTLISARHVITAAHCLHKKSNLKVVRLGAHDFASEGDKAHSQELKVEKQICHPKYNPSTGENDIAIIKLEADVRFTDNIRPICLPIRDNSLTGNLAGSLPFVAGWGSIFYNGPPSPVLLEAQVPVVDIRECKQAYSFFKGNIIDDRIICAGYRQGGKDACQGDSGGPLMIPRNSTYYLIGVVSNGYKCAEPGYPGVYTKVTAFLDFISSNMH